jgi:class 3 adenylate cyclase/tetratricopeptide (TPR) repeat protein
MGNNSDHPRDRAASVVHSHDPARYLPPELAAALHTPADGRALAEALVSVTAARYAVATYLPQRLVRRQLEGGTPAPWLEWIDGSLLFADISGSTALAEQLGVLGREGTERVTEFLNEFFAAMIAVIDEYGGDLLNFGGDALLVLFVGPEHAHIATEAALALQRRMHGYERLVAGVGSFPLHMHIGVESGRLALASVGEPDALRYVVLGEPVNGVARAESLAPAEAVVLGPRALEAVAVLAEIDPLEEGFARVVSLPACQPLRLPELEPAHHDDLLAEIAARSAELDRLTPYLPPSLLARILADPLRPLVEADLRPVTVLFAQVLGLGALARLVESDLAARLLQLYVAAMQAAVREFGGVVNKLDVAEQGDKLLVIFGAPLAFEDHAERAVRAALAMQAALPEVNARIQSLLAADSHTQPELQQRIGLNTGTVFAGNVGTDERKEFTVMGDAVNTAARVMALAPWGQVWVSPSTQAATEGRFDFAHQGAFALKGKRAPLRLSRLDGERRAVSAGAHQHALVGRQVELAWLRERLRIAQAGRGQTVRVCGEAGVGKSRLVEELAAEAERRGLRVVPASCYSYTAAIPYTPWAEWLKAACGIEPGDGPARRTQLLASRLAELGEHEDEWLPLLADLVRVEVPDTRLTRALDPQLRQERRFELLCRLVLRAAAEAPLLVLIEDLHWADLISLDLWRQLAASIAEQPILLLGVHRSAFGGLGQLDDGADVLQLDDLSSDESRALVESRLGADLPPELTQQLVERAAGNPLYLEELLRALVERGLLVEQSGRMHLAGDLAGVELPDSLSGLLLARIDRLDEHRRTLLRVASVIGQRFPFSILRGISATPSAVLLSSLLGLSEQALIEAEREDPERVDIFRHALIHEVAYNSLLYARRRELHGRIGDLLERLHADDLDDFCGLLAHHYRLSDRHDKAIFYLLKAGHAARAIFANEEAIRQYNWAIDLIADEHDPRDWEARAALADVLAVVGRYDEALAAYHALIGRGPELPPALAVELRRKRGSLLEKQGRFHEALEQLRAVETRIQAQVQALSPLAMPTLAADLATVLVRLGEYDEAIRTCEQGLAQVVHDRRTRDDELIEARLHATIGTIAGMRGDYSQARHHFERSLVARTLIDDLMGQVSCHNNLGYLWQLQSDYEQATEHYAVAQQLAQQLGMRYALYFTYANSAYADYCLGRYAEAERAANEALLLCEAMNNRSGRAHVLDTLGLIRYSRGAYAQAIEAFSGSLDLHRALGSSYQEGNTLAAGLALVYNATGEPERGLELARQALARGHELQAQQLQCEALNAMAESLLLLSRPAEAREAAEQAVALGKSLGSKAEQAVALRLLGQAAAAVGELGAPFFEASLGLASEINNAFELARTQAAYGAALRSAGNLAGARSYLQAARQSFSRLGADGELRRLEALSERM